MIDWILNFIGGDYNKKQIDAILPIVTQINHYYADFDKLTDDEIKLRLKSLRKDYKIEKRLMIFSQKLLLLLNKLVKD